jgi:hypothetical protein
VGGSSLDFILIFGYAMSELLQLIYQRVDPHLTGDILILDYTVSEKLQLMT